MPRPTIRSDLFQGHMAAAVRGKIYRQPSILCHVELHRAGKADATHGPFQLCRDRQSDLIYFKGTWQRPFEEKFTGSLPFYVTSNYTAQAKLMQRTDHFSYAETDNQI